MPSALGMRASAPASASTFMTSRSVVLAARKNAVAPSRFTRLRWPSFMPFFVMRALTLTPRAIIFLTTLMLSRLPVGTGPGVYPRLGRRLRTV